MKEQNESCAYNKRRRHATPPAPVCPPLCLTVFGHYSESISTLTKSKVQMTLPVSNIRWNVRRRTGFALANREGCLHRNVGLS